MKPACPHCECEASLDYSLTLCLKQNKAKQNKQKKPRKENDAIPKGHTPVTTAAVSRWLLGKKALSHQEILMYFEAMGHFFFQNLCL